MKIKTPSTFYMKTYFLYLYYYLYINYTHYIFIITFIILIIIIKITQHQTTCKDSELFNQLLPKIHCIFMLLFVSDQYQRLSVACFSHTFVHYSFRASVNDASHS